MHLTSNFLSKLRDFYFCHFITWCVYVFILLLLSGHDFEQVRSGGGGSKSSAAGAAPRLALGNKFDALRD